MPDQADSLRQLVRKTVQEHPALEPGVPMWVLSGGKPGVGTSTVSLQLALELASLGKRAVLVDANPSQPDLTRRYVESPSGSLSDVLSGKRSIAEVLTPISDHVRFLPGHWDPNSPPELHRVAVKRFLDEIRRLHSHADVILLDAGDGMSPWVQCLWKAAQQILLVTTTEAAAVTKSYATIKLSPWGDVDGKLRLVVNRAPEPPAADQIGNNFAATCRQFLGVKVGPHAMITKDETLESSSENSRMGSKSRGFTQSVRWLAADLLSTSMVLASPTALRRAQDAAGSPAAKKALQKSN